MDQSIHGQPLASPIAISFTVSSSVGALKYSGLNISITTFLYLFTLEDDIFPNVNVLTNVGSYNSTCKLSNYKGILHR